MKKEFIITGRMVARVMETLVCLCMVSNLVLDMLDMLDIIEINEIVFCVLVASIAGLEFCLQKERE
ncbi:TPA: hypothetical protein ACGMZZ_000227 [Streptococcus agalactiae]